MESIRCQNSVGSSYNPQCRTDRLISTEEVICARYVFFTRWFESDILNILHFHGASLHPTTTATTTIIIIIIIFISMVLRRLDRDYNQQVVNHLNSCLSSQSATVIQGGREARTGMDDLVPMWVFSWIQCKQVVYETMWMFH